MARLRSILFEGLRAMTIQMKIHNCFGNLKNNYETVSAPSMVKLDKQFRDLSLKKGQDPDVWITELECIRVRLDDMGSSISKNQCMAHALNNLPTDYDLQLALSEKRIGDKDKPLRC
jgi:hypothetical protein